jgi:hypothetical protein
MARPRRQKQTEERTKPKMAGLDAEQIAALLAKTRTKGQYTDRLNEFLGSGEMGVDVMDWPEMKQKKPNTLKQGFEAAKDKKEAKEGADKVQVIMNEEKVYLINLVLAGVEAGVEEAA